MIRANLPNASRTAQIGRKIRDNWQLYLFILPAVVYFVVFKYWPMYGIQIAFRDFTPVLGITGSKWIGLAHFERFFNSYYFTTLIRNTLSISLMNLIFGFPMPIILALLINEIRSQTCRKFVQTVTYIPHFISSVVMVGMIILFLSRENGIINHLIDLLGFERIAFLQESRMFTWIYVFTDIWQHMGWSAVIYFAALANVDKNLYDAAMIDGASLMQKILHINLPVIAPTIVILLIMRCGSIMSVGYEKVYLMQNATNLSASEVISTYVYKAGLLSADYSFAAAVGLFNSLINCTLLVIVNAITRKLDGSSLW